MIFFCISLISLLAAGDLQSQDFRKEWSNFQGLSSYQIPSAIYTNEVSSASNVILENGVIETALGISSVATPILPVGCTINGFVPYQNTSKQTLIYHCANFSTWQEMNTSDATSNLVYTVGQASRNVAGTTVYGTQETENWMRHVIVGDYWKCAADADSAYIEISAVVSNSSLTLTSAYSGGCSVSGAYAIRKIHTVDTARPYYNGSVLNGWALLLNGDGGRNPFLYDGTDLYTAVGIPSAAVVTVHKNRWFAANLETSGPDNLYWGPVNSTQAWNTTAFEPIFSEDGSGGVVGLVSDGSSIVVFKRYGKIYRIFGDFSTAVGRPDSVLEVTTSFTVGQIAPRTIVKHKGLIWFISSTGLYILNGLDLELAGRNFESFITAVNNDGKFTPNFQREIFSGSFNGRLYLNLDGAFGVIDREGNAILRDSLGDTLFGGFANFNSNLYSSNETDTFRILRIENPGNYGLYDNDGSTNSVNMAYVSDSYCGDFPEYQKDFKDFYGLYEQDASSITGTAQFNQILFDALVDDTTTYLTVSSVTTNGPNTSAGRIGQFAYRLGVKGNCIKWRVRENDRGRRNRIIKVVLRGKNLELR